MPKQETRLSEKDYTQLGRAVEQIIRKDYVDLALNRKRLWKVSFIKGLVSGFGGVLGATMLVALLLWLMSLLGHVPLIGPVIENTRDTIQR